MGRDKSSSTLGIVKLPGSGNQVCRFRAERMWAKEVGKATYLESRRSST